MDDRELLELVARAAEIGKLQLPGNLSCCLTIVNH